MLKRAIYKDHIDGFRAMVHVTRMKVLGNALEMNIDFGIQHSLSLLKNFHAATPRQKLRIASNICHQAIHAVG